jgi:hypothetical protein
LLEFVAVNRVEISAAATTGDAPMSSIVVKASIAESQVLDGGPLPSIALVESDRAARILHLKRLAQTLP